MEAPDTSHNPFSHSLYLNASLVRLSLAFLPPCDKMLCDFKGPASDRSSKWTNTISYTSIFAWDSPGGTTGPVDDSEKAISLLLWDLSADMAMLWMGCSQIAAIGMWDGISSRQVVCPPTATGWYQGLIQLWGFLIQFCMTQNGMVGERKLYCLTAFN